MLDNERDSDSEEISKGRNLIELWSKYEDVAMHFNDLLMRLRTQALGAVTGLIAVASFFVEGGFSQQSGSFVWRSALVGALALLGGWIVLFLLDTFYYSRLLLGAVDALLELEQTTNGFIILSTRINARFSRISARRRRGEPKAALNIVAIILFYLPIAILLVLLACFAWGHISSKDQGKTVCAINSNETPRGASETNRSIIGARGPVTHIIF